MFVLSSMSLQASWGLKHTHIKIKIITTKTTPSNTKLCCCFRWQVNCMNLKGEVVVAWGGFMKEHEVRWEFGMLGGHYRQRRMV